jgi:hypothetical protein
MRILALIAHWKNDALQLVGVFKNADGQFRHAVASDLEERQLQNIVHTATDEQLTAWHVQGMRVAQTIGTPGWEDLFAEHAEEDKRLLEYFVDEECDSWEKVLRQRGAVQQHRRRMAVTAYGQVKLGIRAEAELTERSGKKRQRKEPGEKKADETT